MSQTSIMEDFQVSLLKKHVEIQEINNKTGAGTKLFLSQHTNCKTNITTHEKFKNNNNTILQALQHNHCWNCFMDSLIL